MPLTPTDVHNVAFSKPPIGKRGYNEDEVDAFLDLVEAELGRLIEENNDLREQVEQLEQQLSGVHADLDDARSKANQGGSAAGAQSGGHHGSGAGQAAAGAGAGAMAGAAMGSSAPTQQTPQQPQDAGPRTVAQPTAFGQQPGAQQHGGQQHAGQQPGAQQPGAQQHAGQQSQGLVPQQQSGVVPPPYGSGDQGQQQGANGDHHVQAAKVLGLAQEMADRLTAEAKSEADGMLNDARTKSEQLLSEARTKSDSMVNEARSRAETMLNDARTRAETLERQARDKASNLERESQRKHSETITLIEQQKGGLEKKIEELRTFEREYRTRLKTYLEAQLRDLEGRASAAPAESGGRNGAGGYAATGYGSRAEAGS